MAQGVDLVDQSQHEILVVDLLMEGREELLLLGCRQKAGAMAVLADPVSVLVWDSALAAGGPREEVTLSQLVAITSTQMARRRPASG